MNEPLRLAVERIETPIGEFAVVTDETGRLCAAEWTDHDDRLERSLGRFYGQRRFSLRETPAGRSTSAIRAYFAGDVHAIDNLPVANKIGTDFQRKVWQALRQIPCGGTISYAELAGRIGRPSAVRAVGLANGANPISVVVPCHRVIGSDGSLTGYGGGIERKRWLLAHERA